MSRYALERQGRGLVVRHHPVPPEHAGRRWATSRYALERQGRGLVVRHHPVPPEHAGRRWATSRYAVRASGSAVVDIVRSRRRAGPGGAG